MPDDQLSARVDLIQLDAMLSSMMHVAPSPAPRLGGILRVLLLVILPTALAIAYLWGLAVDRYSSEARFAIVRPSSPVRGASLAAMIDEASKSGSSDDAFAVKDFLESRDAMRLLVDRADLRAAIRPAAADPLWRFPGLVGTDTDENLYAYLQRLVQIDYDTASNIITVRAQAFRPADAQRIATVLLEGSEALVNRLNQRARGDAIRVARADVERARAAAFAAGDELTRFRQTWAMVDPNAMSQVVMATISTLSLRLAESTSQLDVTQHSQPQSPQIAPLKARIRAILNQIARERASIAGTDSAFADRVAEYERLLLQLEITNKGFVSALSMLESVQLDAERQQAYVSRVVSPWLPDEHAAPHRIAVTIGVLLCGLIAYAIARPVRA